MGTKVLAVRKHRTGKTHGMNDGDTETWCGVASARANGDQQPGWGAVAIGRVYGLGVDIPAEVADRIDCGRCRRLARLGRFVA